MVAPLHNLVYNELIKIISKKRILVIALILLILIPIFTYAQLQTTQETIKKLGTSDWRTLLQQQIIDQQNRLTSSRLPDEFRKFIQLNIQQQQYYLNNNINPAAPGAPTFMRNFVEQGVSLFIPLLIVVVAADLVSSEQSGGTIKLLLTRPVRRWKILLSKYIALLLTTSLIITITAVLSYLISGVVFGYSGWTMPVLIGFSQNSSQILVNSVQSIPQWEYLLMAYGLAWFACVTVATISFMVSVLVRNTASSMGIMLAAIISGSLLAQLAPNWNQIKYVAFVQLNLIDYLSGDPILINGLTLPFSLAVLSVWSIIALIISFVVFTRRDVLA